MERGVHRADFLVPVPGQEAARAVDDERQDRQDAERPGQPQLPQHGVGGERVRQPAEAGARGADAVGERAPRREPLRDEPHRAREEEAHAGAEGDALRQDQVPDARGEGGADESGAGMEGRRGC